MHQTASNFFDTLHYTTNPIFYIEIPTKPQMSFTKNRYTNVVTLLSENVNIEVKHIFFNQKTCHLVNIDSTLISLIYIERPTKKGMPSTYKRYTDCVALVDENVYI